MTNYRIYFLDRTGRIAKADVLEAATDDDTVTQAAECDENARAFEIWDLGRRVYPPVSPAAE